MSKTTLNPDIISDYKKREMKAFKELKKKQNMLAALCGNNETFLDPIMDALARYMDLYFQCDDFMKELCK